jgi:hypothetical protein
MSPDGQSVEVQSVSSKSFADVVDSLLTDGRKLFRFCILATLLPAVVIVFILVIFGQLSKFLGAEKSEISLGSIGTTFSFQSTSGNKHEYLVLIDAQERWQDTGIQVVKGDHLTFKAGGRINIDLRGVVEQANKRFQKEVDLERERHLNRNSEEDKDLPENYFDENLWRDLQEKRKYRPWVGPDGYDYASQAWRPRQKRRLLPQANLGALVGEILDYGGQSASSFAVGSSSETFAAQDGKLMLAINDVKDPRFEDMFFADNLGFLWVKIDVEKGRF